VHGAEDPYGQLYRIRAEDLAQRLHTAQQCATSGRYQADTVAQASSAGLLVLQQSVLRVLPEDTPQLLQRTSLDLAHSFPTDLQCLPDLLQRTPRAIV
jgi:hypothetical protein